MMAETTREKAVCEKCGVDVRENTAFCYNCGHSFTGTVKQANGSEASEMSDETRSALDDLASKLKIEETESVDRLALAAAERKKARVAPRRTKEDIWEGSEGRSGAVFFVISLVIFLIVAAAVFITVYWK